MFAKTKTQTKILAGFTTAIVISLLVGWIGYRAIGSLSGQVCEVGGVRLASLAAIKEIEVAAGQIEAAQRTLLRPRHRPYDSHPAVRHGREGQGGLRTCMELLRSPAQDSSGSRPLETVCACLETMGF